MNATAHRVASGLGVLALIASTAVLLSSCSSAQSRQLQTIKIDGSSTVYPITNAIAADFPATQANKQGSNLVKVTVDVSGTSGGFRKFCEGTADISNASRPILKDEMAVCNRNNVRYYELPIAFDALTVVVNFKSAQDKPQVRDFVEFYLNKAPTSVSSVGYIPLPEEAYHLISSTFMQAKSEPCLRVMNSSILPLASCYANRQRFNDDRFSFRPEL